LGCEVSAYGGRTWRITQGRCVSANASNCHGEWPSRNGTLSDGKGDGASRASRARPVDQDATHWARFSWFRTSKPPAIKQAPINPGLRALDGHRPDGFRIVF